MHRGQGKLTDPQGKLIWQARYHTWGNLALETWHTQTPQQAQNTDTLPEAQNLRFQGQYHDPESGLHYNTFRYYDPDIGRFITPDPIGLTGCINLYQYAPDPIHWIDPWGWQRGKERGSQKKGGFAYGISSQEISDINSGLGNTGGAYRDPSIALYNASQRKGFFNKIGSLIRDIAGGHLFKDANKRTAQKVVEALISRNRICTSVPKNKIKSAIDRASDSNRRDHLKTAEDIGNALRNGSRRK